MNEKELQQIVKDLNDSKLGGIKIEILKDNKFIEQPIYKDLRKEFRSSKYHQEFRWQWNQFVRIVLEDPGIKKNMYDRLLNLILKHRKSFKDYFILKTEDGVYWIPNSIADLNRLEILYMDYLIIFQDIIRYIHYNGVRIIHSGSIVKGKIDWSKTIQKASIENPLSFSTTLKKTDFVTSENILLILCAQWMFRETSRLLNIVFVEPLTEYTVDKLYDINTNTKSLLKRFPFNDILDYSRKFLFLNYDDFRIKALEREAWSRIKQNVLRNSHYKDLLIWIQRFRELNITNITANTPTRHILDSLKNIDTVYEAWIFLEIVELLYEKGVLLDFNLKEKYCKFLYLDKVITLWYEKGFYPLQHGGNGEHAWVAIHTPDFTAMIDNEILGVFDAKNYTESSIGDPVNKMLAYMSNLGSSLGILFFPYFPENWDELNQEKRKSTLKIILLTAL